jgi:hypothetical protein
MNINDKIEGSSYGPDEYNQMKNEIQNFETSAGLTLVANSVQLKQAVSRYVHNGSTYTDSGIADAYTLNAIGSNDKPSAYVNGQIYYFIAGNTNTGSSTATVSGLTAKTIKKNQFADNLEADDITADKIYALYYDSGEDAFELADFTGGGGAGGGGFGINENTQSGDYSLLITDYGVDNDITVVYTGSGGDTFTNLTSASLTAGESYVFIEHRGTGILTIDFANASDTIGDTSLGIDTLNLSPAETVRMQFTSTANEWRLG